MKYNKFNKIIAILLLALLFLTGCSSDVDEVPVEIEVSSEPVEEKIEIVEVPRITIAEAMEKHYGGDLFYQDYGTTSDELNAYFQKRLQDEYREHAELPLYVDTNIEFYNLTLKKVRDGEIEFEEVYGDLKEYVKSFNIDVLHYLNPIRIEKKLYNTKFGYYWTNALRKQYKVSGVHEIDLRYIYLNPEKSSSKDLDQSYSNKYDGIESISRTRNEFSDTIRFDEENDKMLMMLEEKYNEKFRTISGARHEYADAFVIPENHPELYFEVNTVEGYLNDDMYLRLMAQQYMSKEVERIIEEEGASGYIAQVSIPEDRTREAKKPFIMSNIDNDINYFLNDVYDERYDITLNYLLSGEEEINKEALGEITKKIHRLIDKENGNTRVVVMIYFYDVDEDEKKITKELFLKNDLTEHGYRDGSKSTGDYQSNRYWNRVENDAFHYLDTFANKREYMLFVSSTQFTIEDKTGSEIFDLAKKKSLFEK